MPNGTYGGVRGKETKIGREKKKNLRFPTYSIEKKVASKIEFLPLCYYIVYVICKNGIILNILLMRKLFFDMDGVLVNFQSGIDKLSEETKREYEGRLDEVPGIFSLMDPMPHAVEAVQVLSEYYDIYILSTAPWNNPSAWSDKIVWLTKHFGDTFKKRVILTHCKNLCDGDFLVDDRAKNGASEFPGEWVQFGSVRYPDWEEVTRYLISETFLYDEDNEKLKRRKMDYAMVEKTIKTLDDYMKVLNAQCETEYSKELQNKILKLASLTNKWLEVAGEESETSGYDI